MKIITLVENTSVCDNIGSKHGLSYYIETGEHKILVDVGPNDLFYENAKKLGVDIEAVDTVVISHGHYDHGGGLDTFLRYNTTATVYAQKKAFEPHFAYEGEEPACVSIALNQFLKNHRQVRLVEDGFDIDEKLHLISNITGRICFAESNSNLCVISGSGVVPDDFAHEQALIIEEDDKLVLFGGCAHNGIINILDKACQRMGREMDYAISGLHLYSPGTGNYEKEETITELASRLEQLPTRIYTGHCTGQRAYEMLHEKLGDQVKYLAAGSVVEL